MPAAYAREHVELAYATTVYGAQGETTRAGHLMLGEHTSAASAYVAMTRGRHHNVAHLVADDATMPAAQWDRCSPATGPTSDPQPPPSGPPRTSSATAPSHPPDLSRTYSPTCGPPGPGSRPARATPTPGRRTRRAPAGRRDPRAPRARPRPPEWRRSQRQTQLAPRPRAGRRPRRRTQGPDRRPTSAIRNAWRQDLAQARRAAEIVRDGAGRLGQRRRQVRDARHELTAFANAGTPSCRTCRPTPSSWRSKCPGCTDRASKTRPRRSSRSRSPPPTPTRSGSATLHAKPWPQLRASNRVRTQLKNAMYTELRPYGRAAHVSNPRERLTNLTAELANVERDLRTATTRVRAISNEPSIRTLPNGGLDSEHHRWAEPTAVPDSKPTPARRANACDSSTTRHGGSNRPHRATSTPGRSQGIGR